jgi:tetratricopeptide (TPR) repeat protein
MEHALGFFGSKKPPADGPNGSPQPGPPNGDKPGDKPLAFNPEKAKSFFDWAHARHESGAYEYAMRLWLDGLRQDPGSLTAIEGFFKSAAAHIAEKGKKVGDAAKAVSGSGDLDRYLKSLLEWSLDPADLIPAMRAMETASKLKLVEPTGWIADRVRMLVQRDKPTRKDLFLKLRDAFDVASQPEKALDMAERALKLDPTDGALAADIRNLAAKSAMNRGGYAQTGQAGGFRSNIRDMDKQRQLEERDRIVKTDATIDRLVADAEAELARRPDDLPTIKILTQRLRERGRPEDLERAYALLMQAFAKFQQFELRQAAGDIRIKRAKARAAEARQSLAASPEDEAAKRAAAQAARELLDMEIAELRLRVEAYPTDLALRYELGRRFYTLGNDEEAIQHFQEARHDAKHRVHTLNMMGQCFLRMGWLDEAEASFRDGLGANADASPELTLELQYGLMLALERSAEENRNAAKAEEADKLASQIAIKQIGYRDIRARREAIKKLVRTLRESR